MNDKELDLLDDGACALQGILEMLSDDACHHGNVIDALKKNHNALWKLVGFTLVFTTTGKTE